MDFASANHDSVDISALAKAGDGTFGASRQVAVAIVPEHLAAADLDLMAACYDATDPLAVNNSALVADSSVARPTGSSNTAKVVQSSNIGDNVHRSRVIKADCLPVTTADQVPSCFNDVPLQSAFLSPFSNLVGLASGNRMGLHIRSSYCKLFAGFSKHSVDYVS